MTADSLGFLVCGRSCSGTCSGLRADKVNQSASRVSRWYLTECSEFGGLIVSHEGTKTMVAYTVVKRLRQEEYLKYP